MQLGIWLYDSKDPDLAVTRQVTDGLERRGATCLVQNGQHADILSNVKAVDADTFYSAIDALIVLGGDGSMLAAARECAPQKMPMLGINLGHCGFMTECEPGEIDQALDALTKGNFKIEQRMMLRSSILDTEGHVLWQMDALNDITICNAVPVQLIRAAAYIEDCLLERYACDAMIVSSPTGSTAYSMAAGGPIINPQMPCMVLTPVCASTLTARPMVLAEYDRLTLELTDPNVSGLIVADGQTRYPLQYGQRVMIEKSPNTTGLIRIFNRNFYQVFREKRDEWAKDQYLMRGQ